MPNLLRSITSIFQIKLASSKPFVTSKYIGIDLGTTNSCVAVFENGQPKVIQNSNGSCTTPSMVAFDKTNGDILVGDVAKRQAVTNSKNTIFAIKRLIGRPFDDKEVKSFGKHLPYKLVQSSGGDIWINLMDKTYSPSQISSFILKHMKEIAERYLDSEVADAVITIPAYFNDSQRQATKLAGELAGLNVHRMVNEPTAAALAYGIDNTIEKLIAVYDLGGGTFDVSILQIQDGVFEVRSTHGDTLLGGEDFDNVLAQNICEKIKHKIGVDIGGDVSAMQRVKEAAEKAKIALSVNFTTLISLPFIHGSLHFEMPLNRDQFESMINHLIERTVLPCQQAIHDADIQLSEINDVIVVGGMTRLPKVKKVVSEIFQKIPVTGVHPDEAVALGAAIQAGVLAGDVDDVLLLDVTPLSLGIETLGGAMAHLLTRNTTIPSKVRQVFSTAVDGQTQVEINVYQGERELAVDNKLLGNFTLIDIPPMPRGVPRIEVTFDMDANGILNVSARDQKTGKEQTLVINPVSNLTRLEVDKIIQTAAVAAESDKLKRSLLETRVSLKSLCTDIIQKINQFGSQLPFKKSTDLANLARNSINRVDRIGEEELSLVQMQALLKELQDKALQLFKEANTKSLKK